MATTGNRALMLALAGVALLLAATSIAYRSPPPLGPDAPPGAFSAYRAKAILGELVRAQIGNVTSTTAEGLVQAKLGRLKSGATLLDVVGLPAGGVEFSVDAAGRQPVSIQVFDQSYAFPEEGQALQRAQPTNATSSQDGDLTVVHRTVSLDPAAGRAASNPT